MKTVLIVDDLQENRYILEIIFKGNNFKVITATNGSEALELAFNEPPDIIITDILMPVMDGFSLCRKWKTNESLKHIPFVFYTATYTESKDEKFALSLGADRFITKPQEPEKLINIVNELFDEKNNSNFTSIQPLGEEMEFLRQHSETLFAKLEKKMVDLETANTRLKEKEDNLQKNEKFLDSIVENVPNMLFVKDAITLRFVRFNKAGEELLGISKENILGKNDYDIFPEDQASFFIEKDREVLNKKQLLDIPIEKIQTEKTGERILHTRKIPIIGSNGQASHLLGISEDITDRIQAEESLRQTLDKLRKSLSGTIKVLSMAAEIRDPYTAGHQKKVADLAERIARDMGFSEDAVENIKMAAIIHDIGKMSIPVEILSKPGKLSVIEFSLIKIHSQSGYDILKDVGLPYPIAEVVFQHHERLNGSGYPRGLKGEEILPESKIIAVADVVEAMASHRPYRPALGIDTALEEIERNKGILYDEKVVDVCIKLFREKRFGFD